MYSISSQTQFQTVYHIDPKCFGLYRCFIKVNPIYKQGQRFVSILATFCLVNRTLQCYFNFLSIHKFPKMRYLKNSRVMSLRDACLPVGRFFVEAILFFVCLRRLLRRSGGRSSQRLFQKFQLLLVFLVHLCLSGEKILILGATKINLIWSNYFHLSPL